MPLYEYVCDGCGHKFELLRPFSRAGEEAECPRCGKPAGRRMSVCASFSKDASGLSVPVAGSGNPCSGCSSGNCGSCGH